MDTSDDQRDLSDIPGPSHVATDPILHEDLLQKTGEMPTVPVPLHQATRSVGTQTRVATRVKGTQVRVQMCHKGVNTGTQALLRPLVTSRGTMCNLPAKKSSSSSSSSESKSPESKEAESPGYTPDDSDSSDEESSPKKAKRARRGRSPRTRHVPSLAPVPHQEAKYIIFESHLMRLFERCSSCSSGNVIVNKKVTGTHLRVTTECVACEKTAVWDSQPHYGSTPAGNVLLSAATLFAGGSAVKTLRILSFMKVAVITERTFFRQQERILQPVVEKVWTAHQRSLLEALKAEGQMLVIAGDGRADSPGHSAKFGTYTGIELGINKIIDLQLVQSNEVKNSAHMELEGFKRMHQFLTNKGLHIGKLVTDRHRQLAKHVRETSPAITHVYDVWHLAKGIRKKIHALAKKKGCEVVGEWEQSINNHLYWVACSTPEAEPELRVSKWMSLANHIQDVHEGHSDIFPRCLHEELEPARLKKWLKPGTLACEKFETIIASTSFLSDVKKMSSAQQTSSLESFHALINHFAPKLKAYQYHGMLSRLHLAALHYNENSDRPQATTREGKKSYKLKKLKYRPGKATVTPFKGPQRFEYVAELMSEVARSTRTYKDQAEQRQQAPPSLTSKYSYQTKEDIIKQQRSRFSV
ncbi:uncharacterized protein [Diadema antillarum]|uniref:uncharacterized protein n=1 Tax=Diadema antillarum TaxID=105358 RepID=UPI003A83F9BC